MYYPKFSENKINENKIKHSRKCVNLKFKADRKEYKMQ